MSKKLLRVLMVFLGGVMLIQPVSASASPLHVQSFQEISGAPQGNLVNLPSDVLRLEGLISEDSITTYVAGKYEVDVATIAPKLDARIAYAFRKLGFKVYIDHSARYSGYFTAADRHITFKCNKGEEGYTEKGVYYMFGHFLSFAAGNIGSTSEFEAIYEEEKYKYIGGGVPFEALNDSTTYFAASLKDYVFNRTVLKRDRPKTYAKIVASMDKINESFLNKILDVYKRLGIWT